MNAKPNHRVLLSATAAALLAIVTTLPALAAVDCAAPEGVEQRRACNAAAEGVESLRRFTARTRSIYQIDMQAYANAIVLTSTESNAEKTRVAERK